MVTAATKAPEKKWDAELQRIGVLLDACELDWGDPSQNRKMLLPFGIKPLDTALYGMDTLNGEVILIQGPEKQRKSTLAMNIVRHYMQSPKPVEKPLTVIDTLESGMTPKRYRDSFIAMVATQVLMDQGHVYKEFCPVCKEGKCRQLGLSPEFLRFNTRTDEQAAAIKQAIQIMRDWPMMIFGANEKEGDTRSLAASVSGGVDFQSRWQFLIEFYGAKVFVTDHLQQYSFFEQLTDYEKQIRTIAAVSDTVAKYQIVNLLISQVSLTSQREASTGTGKYYASGGKKAAAEATSIISVNYEGGSGSVTITLEDSRKYKPFTMYQPLEDTSGYFFGEVTSSESKAAHRDGMDEATPSYGGRNGKSKSN